jgi:hypothetical protein
VVAHEVPDASATRAREPVVPVDSGADPMGHAINTQLLAPLADRDVVEIDGLESPGDLHLGAVLRSDAAQELPDVGEALHATSGLRLSRAAVEGTQQDSVAAVRIGSRGMDRGSTERCALRIATLDVPPLTAVIAGLKDRRAAWVHLRDE